MTTEAAVRAYLRETARHNRSMEQRIRTLEQIARSLSRLCKSSPDGPDKADNGARP